MVRPKHNGMTPNDQNLQQPANVVVLNVITFQKRIRAQFVKKT